MCILYEHSVTIYAYGCYACNINTISYWDLQMQELGLKTAVRTNEAIAEVYQQLRALAFLPVHQIRPMFQMIQGDVQGNENLQQLTDYVANYWIDGTWSPEDWCVYRYSIRTNNDLEGKFP